MKLDFTHIKNETSLKFGKSLTKVNEYFADMLSIALDAVIQEVDQEKRADIEMSMRDMFRDELEKTVISYTKCLNKATELVANGLGSA